MVRVDTCEMVCVENTWLSCLKVDSLLQVISLHKLFISSVRFGSQATDQQEVGPVAR